MRALLVLIRVSGIYNSAVVQPLCVCERERTVFKVTLHLHVLKNSCICRTELNQEQKGGKHRNDVATKSSSFQYSSGQHELLCTTMEILSAFLTYLLFLTQLQ